MTAASAEPAIGPRTRALLPVHLFGNPAPIDELRALAAASTACCLLEDAAQAAGAPLGGRRAGRARRRRDLQLLPLEEPRRLRRRRRDRTDDDEVAARARRLRVHGSADRTPHRGRLQLAPRRAPGRGAARAAAPPRRLDRRAAPGGRRLRGGGLAELVELPLETAAAGVRATTSTSSRAEDRDGCGRARRGRGRRPRLLHDSPAPPARAAPLRARAPAAAAERAAGDVAGAADGPGARRGAGAEVVEAVVGTPRPGSMAEPPARSSPSSATGRSSSRRPPSPATCARLVRGDARATPASTTTASSRELFFEELELPRARPRARRRLRPHARRPAATMSRARAGARAPSAPTRSSSTATRTRRSAAALVAAKLPGPGRPRRGRPALLRPRDAGGGQPGRRRPPRRPPALLDRGGDREPPRRGSRRAGVPRRRRDGRHRERLGSLAERAREILGRLGLETGELPGGDPAPGRQRRRSRGPRPAPRTCSSRSPLRHGPLVFPVPPAHPGTRSSGAGLAALEASAGVLLSEPLGYLDFACLRARRRGRS